MRSDVVFLANQRVGNRYELCRLAANITRRFHFLAPNTQEAINHTFESLCYSEMIDSGNRLSGPERDPLGPSKQHSLLADLTP